MSTVEDAKTVDLIEVAMTVSLNKDTRLLWQKLLLDQTTLILANVFLPLILFRVQE